MGGEGLRPDGEIEKYMALELLRAICVSGPAAQDGEIDVGESGIMRVHLVVSPPRRTEQDKSYVDKLIGKPIRAKGTLLHQATGHHHETLVLVAEVVNLRQQHRSIATPPNPRLQRTALRAAAEPPGR